MHESAVAYLEQVNSDGHALYRRTARAALWMESTCGFLKDIQAEVRNQPTVCSSSQVKDCCMSSYLQKRSDIC